MAGRRGSGWLGTHTAYYSSGHSWSSSCYSPGWVGRGAEGFPWISTPPPIVLLQFSSPRTIPSTKHFDEKKQGKSLVTTRTLTRLQGRKSCHSNTTYMGLSQTGQNIYERKHCMNNLYLYILNVYRSSFHWATKLFPKYLGRNHTNSSFVFQTAGKVIKSQENKPARSQVCMQLMQCRMNFAKNET